MGQSPPSDQRKKNKTARLANFFPRCPELNSSSPAWSLWSSARSTPLPPARSTTPTPPLAPAMGSPAPPTTTDTTRAAMWPLHPDCGHHWEVLHWARHGGNLRLQHVQLGQARHVGHR